MAERGACTPVQCRFEQGRAFGQPQVLLQPRALQPIAASDEAPGTIWEKERRLQELTGKAEEQMRTTRTSTEV